MTMSKAKMQKELNRREQKTAKALEQDDLPGAKENLEWLKAYNDWKAVREANHYRLWALAITIVCLVLVSIVAGIRKPITNVRASVLTKTVRLHTKAAYSVPTLADNRLTIKRISIKDATEIELIPTGIPAYESGDNRLEINGNRVIWSEWEIGSNTEIDIERTPLGTRCYVRKGSMQLLLLIERAELIINRERMPIENTEGKPPHFLTVRWEVDGPEPASFEVADSVKLSLPTIGIDALSFTTLDPHNHTVSGIVSGEVELLEINKQHTLGRGQWLSLAPVDPAYLSVLINKQGIAVDLQSKVSKLEAGIQGYLRNLKPSWLQYIYHNEGVILIWSAFLFISGILWSLKKLF